VGIRALGEVNEVGEVIGLVRLARNPDIHEV